jgi:hypothetical protein
MDIRVKSAAGERPTRCWFLLLVAAAAAALSQMAVN